MEKVKKNSSIKKILALTLAFMMVFTGMGIGQWGLEDAWADTVAVSEPGTDSNGVYQIGTAAELLWFQQQVSGGQTSINAVLTDNIDLSSVCSETNGSWTAIPAYEGTFDGQGHKISSLYISEAAVAKQGLFGELSSTGVVKNLGVTNSTVEMSTSDKINNSYAAILVGCNNGGTIMNCYVSASFVKTYAKLSAKSAAICGGSKGGLIVNCYSVKNTINETNNKYQIGGICGYSSGSIENCYVIETSLVTTSTNAAVRSICGSNSGATVANCYYSGKSDDKAIEKSEEWFKSVDAITALGSKYFAKDTKNNNNGYPVLTYAPYTVDTSALDAVLAEVITSGNYYIANDRYNGKTTITDLVDRLRNDATIKADRDAVKLFYTYNSGTKQEWRIDSFWALYEAAMGRVNTIYPAGEGGTRALAAGVKQNQVDAAAALLEAAIADLIPTTQVNATELYEVLNARYRWMTNNNKIGKIDVSYSGENIVTENTTTAVTWAPYAKALKEGQDYLNSLYENGEPTEKK